MSKILNASCSSTGVVSCEGFQVTDAQVLSEGRKASEGLLFIDKDNKKYLPSSATDIKDLITSLVQIITQVEGILTGIDAATNTPGAQSSAIASLTNLRTQLNQTKDQLK